MRASSEPRPVPLPVIHRHRDAAALAEGAASWIAGALVRAIAARGRAVLVLAGGSTPRAVHARLIAERVPPIDWRAVWIYFGDERGVAPDHAASNYRMARETLLDHVPVPAAQIHRVHGELTPSEAAYRYDEALTAAPPLDVVMLGMGDDGHVASWFPDTPAPEPQALAVATRSPLAPHDRISMTPGAISAARDVVLIVSGAAKAARLAEVHAELRAERPTLPAARVTAGGGPLRWFVDDAAAAALPPSSLDRHA